MHVVGTMNYLCSVSNGNVNWRLPPLRQKNHHLPNTQTRTHAKRTLNPSVMMKRLSILIFFKIKYMVNLYK